MAPLRLSDVRLAVVVLATWTAVSMVHATPTASIETGALVVTRVDGRRIEGAELIGTTLSVRLSNDQVLPVRIESASADPLDPTGGVTLYGLSISTAQGRVDACPKTQDGKATAIFLPGTWSHKGDRISENGITLACSSGAMAKCVRWGYKPWLTRDRMLDHYQACTRAVTADYCGNGQHHTRNGMPIDIYDDIGIQQSTPIEMSRTYEFESAWDGAGAVCIARSRVPEYTGSASVVGCPTRARADATGAVCTEDGARAAGALIFIRSPLPTW